MRKLTIAVAAFALGLGVAAGCGGNGAEDTVPNDTGAATTDVPLTGTIANQTDTESETETGDDG